MKLTKYEHACIVLEEHGKKIIIDPGAFTTSLDTFDGVVGLIITHEHIDHFEPRWIDMIVQQSPEVKIFAPSDVAEKITNHSVHTVTGGDTATAGPFQLLFTGKQHVIIHADFPAPLNVGVLVNDTVYYGGDSFTQPEAPVKVLLAPVVAPWLKIADVIDFVDAIKPQICIPTHNALFTEVAHGFVEKWLEKACERHNITYKHLTPGDSLEV